MAALARSRRLLGSSTDEQHHGHVGVACAARALRRAARRAAPRALRPRRSTGRAHDDRGRRALPRLLEASSHRRDHRPPRRGRRTGRAASADRCHVPRRAGQRHREPACAAHGAPRSGRRRRDGRRRERRPGGPRGARRHGRLLGPDPRRAVDRTHGPGDQKRREHRHRRLRSGAGDGLRRAARLLRSTDDVPVREQRRRCRLRRGHP